MAAHAVTFGLTRFALRRRRAASVGVPQRWNSWLSGAPSRALRRGPPCSPSLDTGESVENPAWLDKCGTAGGRRLFCLDSVLTPVAPAPGFRTLENSDLSEKTKTCFGVYQRKEIGRCGQIARLRGPGRQTGQRQPQELQAVFKAAANVILGARSAGLEIDSPVRGLRSVRAARSLLEILPMPGSATDPPSETVSVITEINPVRTAFVSFCVTPDAAATLATSSPLDIALCDILTFLYCL